MYLKQLKLIGFKSFVDPTVVPFSSPLVAVVGPNGCGKSNIIDAVRWVLGERSPKHLRGASMIDVIFNGSSQRKAIGQASVELIFDNRLGRLSGPYAGYQEIAVKRTVTRGGDSFYFLNGTRCRRRDITDLFLGTGAGTGGYSIIGQGTISRVIEAHPDELRMYLEEAAGISKYKERRRETLQRIGHARDNLARVADIREELQKQLHRLERQAKMAQQYQQLKEAEQTEKAKIAALTWQKLTVEHQRLQNEVARCLEALEQFQLKQATVLEEKARLHLVWDMTDEELRSLQKDAYQLNLDIVRAQEQVVQNRREQQRLSTEKARLENELDRMQQRLQMDQQALIVSKALLVEEGQEVAEKQQLLLEVENSLKECVSEKKTSEQEWQALQTLLAGAKHHVQLEEMALRHLDTRHQHAHQRLQHIEKELEALMLEPLQVALSELKIQQEAHLALQKQTDREYQAQIQQTKQLRMDLSDIEQQRYEAQEKVNSLLIEQATLMAAQESALERSFDMSSLGLEGLTPLMDRITITAGWERATELVFGESLHALVLDSMATVFPSIGALQGTGLSFLQPRPLNLKYISRYPRLIDHIIIQEGLPSWLYAVEQIYAAATIADALAWLPTLEPHESVVSQDGYWLGPGWCIMDKRNLASDTAGILIRKQALILLNEQLVIKEAHVSHLKAQYKVLDEALGFNEQAQDQALHALSLSRDAVQEGAVLYRHKEDLYKAAVTRQLRLMEEHADLEESLTEIAAERMISANALQAGVEAVSKYTAQLQPLIGNKNKWEREFTVVEQQVKDVRKALYDATLQYNRTTLKTQQAEDAIKHQDEQIHGFYRRLEGLAIQYEKECMPEEALQQLLNQKIGEREKKEQEVENQQQYLSSIKSKIEEQKEQEKKLLSSITILQVSLQEKQLNAQALVHQLSTMTETLVALNSNAEEVLLAIPNGVQVQDIEQMLSGIQKKLMHLGMVNLLAIEEYQSDLERKIALDEQYDDLTAALTTLEAAIVKMDKETESRFKDTFKHVNGSFQSIFPRLFGGGRACLELTCDNLLEAGVVVMAEPPGKRNSTIHLLSGGEKAMTAVALVFAIFELNPSPFCMLDEVDAPLDELNIRRFCDLVKKMSEVVQFLFITHNKVTMELANHLIGVTMSEPGVSRVVAVDVEEALALAE